MLQKHSKKVQRLANTVASFGNELAEILLLFRVPQI